MDFRDWAPQAPKAGPAAYTDGPDPQLISYHHMDVPPSVHLKGVPCDQQRHTRSFRLCEWCFLLLLLLLLVVPKASEQSSKLAAQASTQPFSCIKTSCLRLGDRGFCLWLGWSDVQKEQVLEAWAVGEEEGRAPTAEELGISQ